MEYKKIKPKKIYEEVAEAIYEMIRAGRLKPGEKIDSVQQLAESFQVGRSAIREALTSLRAMGLIEMKQGEGTFVKEFEKDQITFPLSTAILMNKEDIAELVEVRKIIESGTAAAAAKRRTEQHLAMMEAALEAMNGAKGNEELGEKADLQFHLALADAAQNQLLASLMNHVSDLMVETMRETRRVWLFSKQTTLERLYHEHLAIYEAIKNQDETEARNRMLIHLGNVDKILKEYFQHTSMFNHEK
ncbi:FadR/GntR family transcriptional regulator [Neobacillus sp. OS1-2]|uniref:FadR/GntR family transcriptional regulator n=1 Tax=Neobacillus sp. OS1-2 TaxID=3070680 RepID=UPI0027E1FD2F|nr:FadR/GntR family transcriptional regulator [Neobacillus sp. OS1-2]WML41889.1 FadR/GntR family transcriptional regulator [Neobacillus sp. OS1-2]